MLAPVALGVVFVLSTVPQLFWLVFGWTVFPAFGLPVRGLVGLSVGASEDRTGLRSPNGKGRELLLEALRGHGELNPTLAAVETSLTVTEADKMLKELAEGGHLEVRVRGGELFYSLWEPNGGETLRELESR